MKVFLEFFQNNALASIIGVIIGFGLNYFTGLFSRRNYYSKIISAVKLEVEYNAKKLGEFWRKVNREPEYAEIVEKKILEITIPDEDPITRILDKKSTPSWGTKVWYTHIGTATAALSETEFLRFYSFYENLSKIDEAYRYIHATWENQGDEVKIDPNLWIDFKSTVEDSIEFALWIKKIVGISWPKKIYRILIYGNY